MIRYRISKSSLLARIREHAPRWLDDAAARTLAFRKKRRYVEPPSPSWSAVKAVYMAIQNFKCAYCERRLSSNSIEHDLEHYRPKSSVRRWPPVGHRLYPRHGNTLGEELGKGYYLLAYDPLNYLVACKTCNTPHKANYFPILGRRAKTIDPVALRDEAAVLPYPLGRSDDDPERLITFFGFLPVAVARRGKRSKRAALTIDFLALDQRDELNIERAQDLVMLDYLLHAPRDQFTKLRLQQMQAGAERHTACIRAFLRLRKDNRRQAARVMELVKTYFFSNDFPLVADLLREAFDQKMPSLGREPPKSPADGSKRRTRARPTR